MTQEPNKKTEIQVLELTDRLIEHVMAGGLLEGKERDDNLKEAEAIVLEMGDLLMAYLNGKSEHLENLLRQLTAQKLPDGKILESFGEFKTDLEQIISRGVKKYLNLPEKQFQSDNSPQIVENKITEDETVNQKDENHAEKNKTEIVYHRGKPAQLRQSLSSIQVLQHIFPGEPLLTDYNIKGTKVSFYFPQKGLAVEKTSAGHKMDIAKKEKLKSMGLRLVEISENDFKNPKRVERALRRALL